MNEDWQVIGDRKVSDQQNFLDELALLLEKYQVSVIVNNDRFEDTRSLDFIFEEIKEDKQIIRTWDNVTFKSVYSLEPYDIRSKANRLRNN